ncbi:MAG: glycosyltransferase family 1 protein [bacterium]
MRVVINALSARYGGGKTYLWNLLEHVEERSDWQILVLAEPALVLPEKKNIQRLPQHPETTNPFYRSVWERCHIPRLLNEQRADIYFCPGGVLNVKVPSACRSVVMFRNMLPFDRETRSRYGFGYMKVRNLLLEGVLLNSMRNADLLICVSEYARGLIEKRLGDRKGAMVTISHGVADDFRGPQVQQVVRPAWIPKEEYLLYVSFLELYKNQLEVIRGYSILRQIRRTSEKLVLVGHSETPYGRKVRREIRRRGLEKDVLLMGTVAYEELPKLYQHAKINLFASSCENCPNIMLEAMASGRPLLASKLDTMREFGGDAAVYFNPHDPEDIAQRIASVIDDETLLRKLSEMVGQRAERYTWKSTAALTVSAISQLAAGHTVDDRSLV